MQQKALSRLSSDPAWIAALVTVIASIWIIVSDDLINSDGVLYLEVAAKILAGDLAAAVNQYNWPFYSLLIAAVSKISFLPLESSAYVVNVSTQALLTFMFVRCAQALGGNTRVAVFAAILILTNVTMNGYRDQIVRDFGYWAFFFTALYYFLRYQQFKVPKYAIGFSLSMLVATLFRIEGIVFLVAAPFLVIFYNKQYKENIGHLIWLLSPVILMTFILIAVFIITDIPEYSSRITDPFIYLGDAYQNILTGISEKGRVLEKTILLGGAKDMGTESMFAILFMMLVAKIISASGVIPLFFFVNSYVSDAIRNIMIRTNVINGFMIINVLILGVFLLSHSFLSPRYTMTMALLMTLPAAFGLSFFMEKHNSVGKWHKRGKILIIVVLVYMFLDGITSFGSSKHYIKESGMWLSERITSDERLVSNERAIYYYAGKDVDIKAIGLVHSRIEELEIIERVKNKFDYLAIGISRKQKKYEDELIEWLGSKPIYKRSNERGDAVVIFKLK